MNLSLFSPPPSPVPAWNAEKLPRQWVERLVPRFRRLLDPVCSRLEIAGSMRREREQVHDLEFVAIETEPWAILRALREYQYHSQLPESFWIKGGKINPGRPSKQLAFRDLILSRDLGNSCIERFQNLDTVIPIQVELYISQPEYWGWTYFIRTGSQDWNLACMARLHKLNRCVHQNRLYCIAPEASPFPISWGKGPGDRGLLCEEEDVFQHLQIQPVPPRDREDSQSLLRAVAATSNPNGVSFNV